MSKDIFIPGNRQEILLNLNGAIAWDADGFWPLTIRVDWLWYPWLQGGSSSSGRRILWPLPMIKRAGEVILTYHGRVPQENSLKDATGEDGTMEIPGTGGTVTISGEYWR